MSFYTADRLYGLLPAFYRVRDAELAAQARTAEQAEALAILRAQLEAAIASDPDGPDATRLGRELARRSAGPLRALVEIVAEQMAVLEDDIEQIEDDQFIETCAEWVVPYLGELVGARGLTELPGALSRRAQVANTLAYRRRKGTASVLEQLARDVTGWDASVVEYFERLIATQYMNHIRPHALATVNLRGIAVREPAESPFAACARTIDVRRIASGRGLFNIPNVGVHLFRIRSFAWTDVPPFRHDARRFSFHPLGLDIPLFNAPVSEDEITHLATPDNVAHPLARRAVRARLPDFYGRNRSLSVASGGIDLPRSEVSICDLSEWTNAPPGRLGIDPELGRMVFPVPQQPGANIRTTFQRGFGFAMGGGEYGRAGTLTAGLDPAITVRGGAAPALQQALADVTAGGVVEVRDSEIYRGVLTLTAGPAATIEIRGADRVYPTLALAGDFEIVGAEDAEIRLNGLLISGGAIRVPAVDTAGMPNLLRKLRIEHCTISPGMPPVSLIVEARDVVVEIERSILGAVRIVETASSAISGSIVDAGDFRGACYAGPGAGEPGGPVTMRNVTAVGRLSTRVMTTVSNSILLAGQDPHHPAIASVRAERVQEGCVRFSYLPRDAVVPERFQCQPGSAADAARVRPVFQAVQYGDPGYMLLDPHTPREILAGADDGAEMGAFHDLYQPQREAALGGRLREHLRFGLEAGVFYAS